MSKKKRQRRTKPVSLQPTRPKSSDIKAFQIELKEDYKKHLIVIALRKFYFQIEDLLVLAGTMLPAIEKALSKEENKIIDLYNQSKTDAQSSDSKTRISGIRTYIRYNDFLTRFKHSKINVILERSLFIYIFSIFDNLIASLIRALYSLNPDLYNSIGKELSLSRVLSYNDITELKSVILEEYINSVLRESYIKQFDMVGSKHGIDLVAFENWKSFIECSQRRNIMVHNNGIVDEQYISNCENNGYIFSDAVNIGDDIGLGPEYFISTCDIVIETGIRLTHLLWRHLLPDKRSLEISECGFCDVTYHLLKRRSWKLAALIGKFACAQDEICSIERMKTYVNYILAIKYSGEKEKAYKLLEKLDLTNTRDEFLLANFIIREDYEEARSIMLRIGNEGDILDEIAYYNWPLFNEFRGNEIFLNTYKEIYGYDFTSKLSENVEADETVS